MKIWVKKQNSIKSNIKTKSTKILDPRLSKLFLVNSPWSTFAIVAVYIYLVNGAGQRWMKHRTPFELTKIINIYNIFQVVANFYVFVRVGVEYRKTCL